MQMTMQMTIKITIQTAMQINFLQNQIIKSKMAIFMRKNCFNFTLLRG